MNQLPPEIGPTTTAVLKLSQRITPDTAEEVRHLTLDVLDPGFQFVVGQSIGVVVPGPHPFGNSYHVRRYSIANTQQSGAGTTLDILVRRCFYVDEVSGERYPGIASNYLCDAQPGDRLTLSGPYFSPFRIPQSDHANLLMIGTGTGIAPFRAFVQHIYEDRGGWNGQVRLYYGGRSGLDLMYANDETTDLANYYDDKTFKAFRALGTRLLRNSSQALAEGLAEHAAETWQLINEPDTHVFLSGLGKIAQVFDRFMTEQAVSPETWQRCKQHLIEDGRWSELLYD